MNASKPTSVMERLFKLFIESVLLENNIFFCLIFDDAEKLLLIMYHALSSIELPLRRGPESGWFTPY